MQNSTYYNIFRTCREHRSWVSQAGMNLYQFRLLVIFFYFEATTRLASKAVAEAAINDLSSPPNLPSSIANSGNRIVQTLEQIVEELKISNQKVRKKAVFYFLFLKKNMGLHLKRTFFAKIVEIIMMWEISIIALLILGSTF